MTARTALVWSQAPPRRRIAAIATPAAAGAAIASVLGSAGMSLGLIVFVILVGAAQQALP
jgi:hypothetical protein